MFRTVIILLAALLNAALTFAQLRPVDSSTLAMLQNQQAQRAQIAVDWANTNKTRFGLDANGALTLGKAQTDEFGYLHARLLQQYKGINVLGASMVVHMAPDGSFIQPDLDLRSGLNLEVAPRISADRARAIAAAEFPVGRTGAVVLTTANTKTELLLFSQRELVVKKQPSVDPATGAETPGEYEYQTRSVSLAWQFDATPAGQLPRYVVVDANTGRVLSSRESNIYDFLISQHGTANTLQFGQVKVATTYNADKKRWELQDITRAGNYVTNQNNSNKSEFASELYSNGTNTWGDGLMFTFGSTTTANGETAAVDVAYGIEKVYDLLKNVYGRNGIDGAGVTPMHGRVHHDVNYNDAHYRSDTKSAYFGDGALDSKSTRTQYETVAHEFGHMMFDFEIINPSGYNREARGLNEGHGDIMASLAEFYLYASGGEGKVLKDVKADWNWRGRMVKPLNYDWDIKDKDGNVVSTWVGFRYYDATIKEAEEHASGCLYGHIFVFLAHGSSSDSKSQLWSKYIPMGMPGIGIEAAGKIWYRATTVYFDTDPTFFEARTAFLKAAADLYGMKSVQYNAVMNAFKAGGIGGGPLDNFQMKM
jgi:Zn-dependent metalloprotease